MSGTMPRNLTDGDVRRIVRDVLRSQSSIGDYSPASIPWTSIVSPRVAAPTIVPTLTELPTTGLVEGMPVIYDTGTAGVRWMFVYDTSDGTTYPWLYVGGPPLWLKDGSSETSASTSYVSSTTFTSVELPLAGDYDIEFGALVNNDTASQATLVSPGTATTAADDTIMAAVHNQAGSAITNVSVAGAERFSAQAAGDDVDFYIRVTGGTGSFQHKWVRVTPFRVRA